MIEHNDQSSTLKLAPPQIMEMRRIMNFNDAQKLKMFSFERSNVRVARVVPATCQCDDGILYVYPGELLGVGDTLFIYFSKHFIHKNTKYNHFYNTHVHYKTRQKSIGKTLSNC